MMVSIKIFTHYRQIIYLVAPLKIILTCVWMRRVWHGNFFLLYAKCKYENTYTTGRLIIHVIKVNFFWDPSQDMNLSCFPPKIQASDWLTQLVYKLEAWILVGNNLHTFEQNLTQISEKTDFNRKTGQNLDTYLV